MICAYRETPPPRFKPRLLEASEAREAIIESFYAGGVEVLALYPSLEDLLEVLAALLGGFRAATPLPSRLARFARNDGRAWLASNPTPTGKERDCDTACQREPIVVYEGARVYSPAASLAGCDCRVYSVASLEDYGVESSVAWATGPGLTGLRYARIPAATREELAAAVGAARRARARGLAAAASLAKPERVGPFAAFYRERVNPYMVDAGVLGAPGFYALSLFMEPGCYTPVSGSGRGGGHPEAQGDSL